MECESIEYIEMRSYIESNFVFSSMFNLQCDLYVFYEDSHYAQKIFHLDNNHKKQLNEFLKDMINKNASKNDPNSNDFKKGDV